MRIQLCGRSISHVGEPLCTQAKTVDLVRMYSVFSARAVDGRRSCDPVPGVLRRQVDRRISREQPLERACVLASATLRRQRFLQIAFAVKMALARYC